MSERSILRKANRKDEMTDTSRHDHARKWPAGTGTLLLGLALALTPVLLQAQARPGVPVNIQADSAQMDDRTGIATYSGDVVVTHGEMTLWADQITIHTDEDRRPVRIEAEGNPARVESPDLSQRQRVATARNMEYTFDDEVLVLIRNARVQTATEDTRGDRIRYDMINDVVRVEGREGERVQITIQPREE
jgi:lipopolysaccharide export system protein LptA